MKLFSTPAAARCGLVLATALAMTAAAPSWAQTDDAESMSSMTPSTTSTKTTPAKRGATRPKKARPSARKTTPMAPMAGGDAMERGDMTKSTTGRMSGGRGRMPMPMSQGAGSDNMGAGAPMPN